jgi:hypothetical protein
MKKLKGPELKMPELKLPVFLADLYYDLRDRRLLPLLALVVVAIAAVPFLLGGDTEEPFVAPAGPGAEAALESGATASSLTVVEATPGLRDYRKRLRGRVATDPFKQRFTQPAGDSASSSSADGSASSAPSSSSSSTFSEGSATSESPTTTVEVESGGGSSNGGGSSDGSDGAGAGAGSGGTQGPRLIEFVVDVQISRSETTADGGQEMGEPEVRHQVRSLTQLPGKKTPVVTTMGVNLHSGRVVLLVSDDVSSLKGEFKCAARTPTGTCELLEIEPGFPVELVYGPNRALYRIKVTKIDAIWAGRVGDSQSSRASFGGPAHAALPAP